MSLRDWDNHHVWHPFTAMTAYAEEAAPIIVAAEGFELIDSAGRRYLDGHSSLWCNVHGHRVPAIDAAIKGQLDKVAHSTLLGLSNEPSIELARELVQRAPTGLSRVFYSDDGATAVEVAVKLAYQYHRQKPNRSERRDLFVSLSDAYHGDTVGTVSLGGIAAFHNLFGPLLFPTLKVPAPVAYRVPAGQSAESYLRFCHEELERVLAENADRIAAFIIEPLVQCAAGILVHPAGYLRRVRELTRQYGIPLIADEVAVGFGRTGTLLACEQEGVVPDLLCLSKGLTGGYLPLAATLATEEIYAAFLGEPWQGRTFFHGHTYTGNPLGCAAALASIRLFDEHRVLDHARLIAELMHSELGSLQSHPRVGEIRQKGTMVGIEIVKDRAIRQPFPLQQRIGHQICLAARRRGVILRNVGAVVVLFPAPAMPVDLVKRLCAAVVESVREVCGAE